MGLVKTRRLAATAREGGGGSVANVGVLPVPMFPIPNWGLKSAHAGHKMR